MSAEDQTGVWNYNVIVIKSHFFLVPFVFFSILSRLFLFCLHPKSPVLWSHSWRISVSYELGVNEVFLKVQFTSLWTTLCMNTPCVLQRSCLMYVAINHGSEVLLLCTWEGQYVFSREGIGLDFPAILLGTALQSNTQLTNCLTLSPSDGVRLTFLFSFSLTIQMSESIKCTVGTVRLFRDHVMDEATPTSSYGSKCAPSNQRRYSLRD